jgi:hypothetical protein
VYGTILRIKPTTDSDALTSLSTNSQYRIPNDNPFTSASNMTDPIPGWQASWVDEIFAYGLRNPFRMGFDRDTGKLYAGDVGQSQGVSREEVNHIVKGGNYGWVIKEGTQTTSFNYSAPAGTTLIDPIGQYPTGSGGGIAVIGGFVYRGDAISDLEGKYLFAELSRSGGSGGGLLYMDINEPGPLPGGLNQVYDLMITGPLAKPASTIHGVAEDAIGELYFLFNNGQVIKLLPVIPPIPGDYNGDDRVDDLDYDLWQSTFGQTVTNDPLPADGSRNGVVDAADYVIWRKNLGASLHSVAGGEAEAAVPEPMTTAYIGQALALSLIAVLFRRRR